jgi:dTDP-4-dehydrorhamnose 3,5-epimerase
MTFNNTLIPGCYEIMSAIKHDDRGYFVKAFQKSVFDQKNINFNFAESYFTHSKPGVVRGLHFQTPPHDHAKIVICLSGEVIDVVLDIRKGSPTYNQFATFKLSHSEGKFVFIPKGCAHGFCTLSKEATLLYLVDTEYSAQHDSGILWSSISFNWPLDKPIISLRDQSFNPLNEFITPFKYSEIA